MRCEKKVKKRLRVYVTFLACVCTTDENTQEKLISLLLFQKKVEFKEYLEIEKDNCKDYDILSISFFNLWF